MDSRAGKRAIVIVVFFALFLYGFFLSARASLLRDISIDFSVGYTGSGLIFLIAMLSIFLTNLLSGKIMAAWGMKVLYASSMFFIALSVILQALSVSYFVFLLATLAHNFFAGGQNMSGNSLVGRAFYGDGGKKLNSLHLCYALGALSAPFLVGQLSSPDAEFIQIIRSVLPFFISGSNLWRTIFLILGFLFLACLLYVPFYAIKEPFTKYKVSFRSLRNALKSRLLVWLSLAIMGAVALEIGISSWLVYTLENGYGFSAKEASFYLILFFVGLGSGRIAGSFLARRNVLERIVVPIAILQAIITFLGVLFLPDSVLLLAMSGLTSSVLFPTLYYKLSHYFDKNYAESSVIFLLGTGIGASLFPFLVGVIADMSGFVGYGLYVPVCAGLFLIYALLQLGKMERAV